MEINMRNVVLLLLAAGSIVYADAASAQYRRYDHYHHNGGGGNWVAPLIGGMVVGGVLGAIASEPRYYPAPPAYRTECRLVPAYDRYGYYMGDRRECYQVPNY